MRFPVTLDVKPSRRLRAALSFIHLAAFVSLLSVVPDALQNFVPLFQRKFDAGVASGVRFIPQNLLLSLPTLQFVFVVALFALFFVFSWWHALKLTRGVRLRLDSDARIGLQYVEVVEGAEGGMLRDGEVLDDSTVFRWLAVLRIRLEGEHCVRAVVVLSDSLSLADYRRLQLWLRWVLPFKREHPD